MDEKLRSFVCKLLNLNNEDRQKSKRNSLILAEVTQRLSHKVDTRHLKSQKVHHGRFRRILHNPTLSFWAFLAVITLSLWVRFFIKTPSETIALAKDIINPAEDQMCIVKNHHIVQESARPIFDCSICTNLTEMTVIHGGITKDKFMANYAYSRIPVLIKDGIKNWSAVNTFSYDWFRKTYDQFKDAYEVQDNDGQFFPYKTEFETLEDALHMSPDRQKKPWYFGWSNAHSEVGAILRKHYQRPYFLPHNCESSLTDWMFMGTPGRGAHSHLDYVNRPSWQAQVTGSKVWTLVPVPECDKSCHKLTATMTPGDILVVDTNQWYHSTRTLPGNISITIGSEYD